MWLTVEGDACATFADYIKSGGIRLQHGRYTLWVVLTLNKCVPSCFCAYARKFYKITDYRPPFETTGYIQESISLCSIPTKCERIGFSLNYKTLSQHLVFLLSSILIPSCLNEDSYEKAVFSTAISLLPFTQHSVHEQTQLTPFSTHSTRAKKILTSIYE